MSKLLDLILKTAKRVDHLEDTALSSRNLTIQSVGTTGTTVTLTDGTVTFTAVKIVGLNYTPGNPVIVIEGPSQPIAFPIATP